MRSSLDDMRSSSSCDRSEPLLSTISATWDEVDGAEVVRWTTSFFAFGLNLDGERLEDGKARVTCFKDAELLDLVLLVELDFDDIVVDL